MFSHPSSSSSSSSSSIPDDEKLEHDTRKSLYSLCFSAVVNVRNEEEYLSQGGGITSGDIVFSSCSKISDVILVLEEVLNQHFLNERDRYQRKTAIAVDTANAIVDVNTKKNTHTQHMPHNTLLSLYLSFIIFIYIFIVSVFLMLFVVSQY